MSSFVDLTGQRFGKLIVISFAGMMYKSSSWICQCNCGAILHSRGCALKSGAVKNCRKCKKRPLSGTKEYKAWIAMIRRCHTETEKAYYGYGGKGIIVSDRWRESFENFLYDMGVPPTKKHTLDRIENSGNYEPGNCRWVTMKIQGNNRSTNRYIDFKGERKTMIQWCEDLKLPYTTIAHRIKKMGLSPVTALTTPIIKRGANLIGRKGRACSLIYE